MDCQLLRDRLSDYLDGHIVEGERREAELHLSHCGDCGTQFRQLRQTKVAVASLPRIEMPSKLTTNLKVLASQAAERRRIGPFRWWAQKAALWSENLMRPLLGPAAGGLMAAVLLFTVVMVNFRDIVVAQANDVPTGLYTNASVKSTPLSYEFDEVNLDVFVDEQGRVIDYSFPEGYGALKTSALRRKLEHSLLFTQFTPATAFGQPTAGWVRISFRRSEIDVKG